jgi:hypothetical protein
MLHLLHLEYLHSLSMKMNFQEEQKFYLTEVMVTVKTYHTTHRVFGFLALTS